MELFCATKLMFSFSNKFHIQFIEYLNKYSVNERKQMALGFFYTYHSILSIKYAKQLWVMASSLKTTKRGATISHIPCIYPTSKLSQT